MPPEPERSEQVFPRISQLSVRRLAAAMRDAPVRTGSTRPVHVRGAIPSTDWSPSAPEALTFSSIRPAFPDPCLQERQRVTLRLRLLPKNPSPRPIPPHLLYPRKDVR